MKRDIRDSALYREAEQLFATLLEPGTGRIADVSELHVSAEGRTAVCTCSIADELKGLPATRVGSVALSNGRTAILTKGPNSDRHPKLSPDGRNIAFLSDRHCPGDFQAYILDTTTGLTLPVPRLSGWVEYLHWSPDGRRILLGIAGYGADVSGGQGAISSQQKAREIPSWMPTVETGGEDFRWRRAWVYETETRRVARVSDDSTNVWESVWCGNDALAAVVSPGPGEGLWYGACARLIDLRTLATKDLYQPRDQLGWPAATPSGKTLAIVEAVCSDRTIVAGTLQLIDTASGHLSTIDTHEIDITYTEWRSEERLLLAGHRGFDTVVAIYDCGRNEFREVWSSGEVSPGGRYAAICGLGEEGDFAALMEGFTRSPELALVRGGRYTTLRSFDLGYAAQASCIEAVERHTWQASDGLDIQGWILRPRGSGPHPVVMVLHGGPVWLWHPFALMRGRYVSILMLITRGYAIFLPNPRGSSGRGQEYSRRVVGDLGGADARDCLSGLDDLIARGVADPSRLGVTGISYGGFLTSWLITQDTRFAAAAPASPHTNQVSEHLLSNIPHFMRLFLQDRYDNPNGKYFDRSPIMHARKAKTPTLNICGSLDRCTPPEEAAQFHNALLENGVESVLVTYPEEGHGVRMLPAAIDHAARLVDWFMRHLPV